MVYAEIKNKRDTLVLGFPRNAVDMQIKLSSIGIHKNVKDIPLSVQESDDIRAVSGSTQKITSGTILSGYFQVMKALLMSMRLYGRY